MTITMTNYAITWTDPDGVPRASAVSYDQNSAEDRKERLEAGGCTSVEIKATKVGKLLEPKA